MATITPRWEWRTFSRHLGPAEAALAALTPTSVQESEELYLLSGHGDNVKVRDDLMDIKVLQEVDDEGLERWTPVLKAAFPLTADDASRVFEAFRLPAPAPAPAETWTLDAFLSHLEGSGAEVRAVRVHKRRERFSISGCSAEVTEITVDGSPARTVAIESEDAAAVVAAVRSVGLGGYRNTSYPRGLAAIVDGAPARFAVIDVGTNSVKGHVAERAADGTWRALLDRAEIARLGEGLEASGRISEAAIDRTLAAIVGLAQEARELDVEAIAAVGTAGLRMAANTDEVSAAITDRTGIPVEVISGEEESRLAYLAAAAGLGLDPAAGTVAVFDTGGGSSQFTFGQGGRVEERFSVDVGATRLTEAFGLDRAVSPAVLGEALATIAADLRRLDGRPAPQALVGMGGAITNLTAVQHALATYDPAVVQGSVLTLEEVDRQIERYRTLDAEARRSIVGLQPKRAEVILAGACIVRTVMEKLAADRLIVSDRGLRHGLLMERFGP